MYVGVITKTVYGTSGNELCPPVESKTNTVYLFGDQYTEKHVKEMLQIRGMNLRKSVKKAEPYSIKDGYDWRWFKVDHLVEDFNNLN